VRLDTEHLAPGDGVEHVEPPTTRSAPRRSGLFGYRLVDERPVPASRSGQENTARQTPRHPTLTSIGSQEQAVVAPILGKRPAALTVRAEASSTLQPPPDDVRSKVERRLGVRLDRVAIDRDRRTSTRARQLRARAFTEAGMVRLPREAGPLDAPHVKALVAHELVHVAQQRRRGRGDLREESSTGRVLEAQAVAVEREWPPTPAVEPPPVAPSVTHRTMPGVARSEPTATMARIPVADARPIGVQAAPHVNSEVLTAGISDRDAMTRLYEQIVERIRAELLVDRERAGSLADRR
jgi:hypothetical protein